VSAKKVKDQLGKSKYHNIIIDTRSFSEYKNGHIPGALNVDLFQYHWFDTSRKGIKEFNRQSRMLLTHFGIQSGSQVIFYDNVSGILAARGAWLMLYFSHNKVAILDGGFQKWKKMGYNVELKSNPLKYSKFKGRINSKVLATAKEIKRALNKKNVSIVDARSIKEYNGSDVRAVRRGHIPSAINIDWESNIENEVFKRDVKLRRIYSNVPKKSRVFTYCQGGYRAANSFLALKLLGYENVKMYLGSWGEWGNELDLPVSIGG
jgi:thiosulfate/3-mercaptopyruvate sulfurtransferase